jgi:hypothetical protein
MARILSFGGGSTFVKSEAVVQILSEQAKHVVMTISDFALFI